MLNADALTSRENLKVALRINNTTDDDFLDQLINRATHWIEQRTNTTIAPQALTLELALRVLEQAPGARTTMQSPLRWCEDASWKLDYNNIAQMSPDELARRRAEFDKQKDIARGNRAA